MLQPHESRYLTPCLTIIVCLSAFTIDVCIPAFPAIQAALGVSSGQTHLIIAAYLVSYALAQIPLGFLSEKIGRVNALYCGLLVFVLGGVLCTFSNDLTTLLLGRFIQGIGGASGPVVARAIAKDVSSGAELAKLMTLLVSALAVSTIVAPIFGSLLLAIFPWWSVFAASLLIGIVSLLLVYFFVPETSSTEVSSTGSFSQHWKAFWRSRAAAFAAVMLALLFCSYMAFVSSFSTIAADQFSLQAKHIGWYFAGFVGFYLLGNYFVRRSLSVSDESRLLRSGSYTLIFSELLFLLIIVKGDIPLELLVIGSLSFLFAMGMLFGTLGAVVMKSLPHMSGSASGIMGTIQILAGFIGSSLSASFYGGDAYSTIWIITASVAVFILVYFFSCEQLFAQRDS